MMPLSELTHPLNNKGYNFVQLLCALMLKAANRPQRGYRLQDTDSALCQCLSVGRVGCHSTTACLSIITNTLLMLLKQVAELIANLEESIFTQWNPGSGILQTASAVRNAPAMQYQQ